MVFCCEFAFVYELWLVLHRIVGLTDDYRRYHQRDGVPKRNPVWSTSLSPFLVFIVLCCVGGAAGRGAAGYRRYHQRGGAPVPGRSRVRSTSLPPLCSAADVAAANLSSPTPESRGR